MPEITPDMLSEEVRGILGKEADAFDCTNDQPVCTPDSRVTVQIAGDVGIPRIEPAYIANAEKGDLILCPGGSGGMIGDLLLQLDPDQVYSHMGIMTKDHTELRHATVHDERTRKFAHRSPNPDDECSPTSFFLPKALGDPPTDAFQECALRYGWPGTLNQTVHVAWLNWQYSGFNLDKLPPAMQPWRVIFEEAMDGADQKPLEERLVVKDRQLPDDDNSFKINAITLGPVSIAGKVVHPLVVKSCDALQSASVRAALDRVVDEAKRLRGHYRFYSYTRADVGLDPNKFGPAQLEDLEPAPGCTGLFPTKPTTQTVPMVCSTFIWLAVQAANKTGLPRIILDGRREDRTPLDYHLRCVPPESAVPRQTLLDKIDNSTPDGLYFYGKSERAKAGEALYKDVHDKVANAVYNSVDLQHELEDKLHDAPGGIWTLYKVLRLIAALGLGPASQILKVPPALLEALMYLFTDMPDDVANQLCNAFASDDATIGAKDSTAWHDNPGEGYTVSPDNILRSWAPPTQADAEVVYGLYGYNEVAQVIPPMGNLNPPPRCSWQISQGFSLVSGKVLFEGVPVAGVKVRIGCTSFTTGLDGMFIEQPVPQGSYWCDAHYTHPVSRLSLKSDGQVVTVPSRNLITIELKEPPVTRRRIWFEGRADLTNRHPGAEIPGVNLVVKDWTNSEDIDSRKLSDAFMDPEAFYFPPDNPKYKDLVESFTKTSRPCSFAIEDWGWADLKFDLEVHPNGDVQVTYKVRLREAGDPDWQEDSFLLPVDTVKTVTIHMRTGVWPARAYIEVNVHNDRVGAPPSA